MVPGANRESAAGASCDGAGKSAGVAVGVGVAVGLGVGVGVGFPRVTVIVADFVVVPTIAPIVTTVFVVTADVAIGKVTDVWPGAILTAPGGLATELLVVNVAEIPSGGAGEFKSTVPVALVPPGTLVGLIVTPWIIGGALGSG